MAHIIVLKPRIASETRMPSTEPRPPKEQSLLYDQSLHPERCTMISPCPAVTTKRPVTKDQSPKTSHQRPVTTKDQSLPKDPAQRPVTTQRPVPAQRPVTTQSGSCESLQLSTRLYCDCDFWKRGFHPSSKCSSSHECSRLSKYYDHR